MAETVGFLPATIVMALLDLPATSTIAAALGVPDGEAPCGPCNDAPCHGDWGAWRACGGALVRRWIWAVCDLAVEPEIAAEILHGEIRYYLTAAGWSP